MEHYISSGTSRYEVLIKDLAKYYAGKITYIELLVLVGLDGKPFNYGGWYYKEFSYNIEFSQKLYESCQQGWIETGHNWVQVMFPTKKESQYGNIFPVADFSLVATHIRELDEKRLDGFMIIATGLLSPY